MKFKKILIILSAVSILSMSIASVSSAADVNDYKDFQIAKANNLIVPNDVIDQNSVPTTIMKQQSGMIMPMAEDPGTGALRVNLVTYGSYADLKTIDSKTGTYNLIKDSVLTVLGALTTTVKSVVLSIANLLLSDIDTASTATAKTQTSYTYPTKQGQVWYLGMWNTLFESTNRNTYKHEYAIYWDTNKNQRQATKDYVPATGYSAINVEYAPHYNDNTYIQNQAYQNYLQGKKYTTEDYFN